MRFDVHHHIASCYDCEKRVLDELREIKESLNILTEKVCIMANTLNEVVAALESESVVIDSVVVLLTQLSEMIQEASVDPAALAAVLEKIETNKKVLADAVVANTPSA